ncbi:MAG: DUF4127 family protein [Bacilli bacterium]
MKTNVGLIPLDSRPCNYDWVIALAKMANINLITMEKNLLGTLHSKLDFTAIQNFLKNEVNHLDYLICPIDSLISGGLIQSRKANYSVEELDYKIKFLKSLKTLNPKLKIYAFDTVLRTSISTFDEKTTQYWKLINEFSRYKGQFLRYKNPSDYEKFQEISSKIPIDILKTYEIARIKKHEVNKIILDLLKQNKIDFLLLLQEDSMPNGLQTLEHDLLEAKIKEGQLATKAWLYNGTDEASCFILAKIIREIRKQDLTYFLLHPNEELLKNPLPFEDRPYIENLQKMTSILSMKRTDDFASASFVLAVFQSNNSQKMEVCDREKPLEISFDPDTLAFIDKLNIILKDNIPVFLLDINAPNGACYQLLKQIDFLKLKGFSGWNTASNATGSLLATALITCDKHFTNHELCHQFLLERIIDDCFYQDIVRPKIHQYLHSNLLNIFDFKPSKELIQLLQTNLHALSDPLFPLNYNACFPWNRAFEIKITIEN